MKLQVWNTVGSLLFCLGAATLAGAGCSSSSTPDNGKHGDDSSGGGVVQVTTPPTGCNADPSVDCSGGGDPFSCAAGDNPESDTTQSLSCSDPTPDGGNDDFCCFVWTVGDSSCTPDDDITAECSDLSSYGYQCSDPSDDPTSLDSSLNCSGGVTDPDGSSTDFCCTLDGTAAGDDSSGDDGTAPAGCSADPSVDCSGGGDPYSCAAGDNPEAEDPSLSCSDPTADGDSDDFCCFAWTYGTTTCTPDDDLTSFCQDGSYGYQCDDPTDDPSSLDTSLTCSDSEADPDGVHTDFCCTY